MKFDNCKKKKCPDKKNETWKKKDENCYIQSVMNWLFFQNPIVVDERRWKMILESFSFPEHGVNVSWHYFIFSNYGPPYNFSPFMSPPTLVRKVIPKKNISAHWPARSRRSNNCQLSYERARSDAHQACARCTDARCLKGDKKQKKTQTVNAT